MKTFTAFACAAFIGAALSGPVLAQSSISDIEARLAIQRGGAVQNNVRQDVRTRGIEEVLPSQLRKSSTAVPAAATPAAQTAAVSPSTTKSAPAASGVSVARLDPAPTPASTTKTIAAEADDGQVIQVKVYDEGADISDPVRFEHNSAFLTAQGKGVLDVYCAAIKGSEAKNGPAPGGYVLIGHADASGDARYNEVLSKKRAEESRRYMISSCGLPGERLRAVGLGEAALKDPRHPNSAVNRRVELQIGS